MGNRKSINLYKERIVHSRTRLNVFSVRNPIFSSAWLSLREGSHRRHAKIRNGRSPFHECFNMRTQNKDEIPGI